RSALNRVFEQRESTLSLPILVRFNGSPHRVLLLVRPVTGNESHEPSNAGAIFIEGEPVDENLASLHRQTSAEAVPRFPHDPALALSERRPPTGRAEADAAIDERRAANEERQSSKAEYPSTSEELETSKEELKSINEELQTVNSEVNLKPEAISRAQTDLQSLV